MRHRHLRALLGAAAVLVLAAPVLAQTPAASELPAPPPGGIVPRERPYALSFGMGALSWGDEAPYDDHAMASLALERTLLRGLRGRAGIGYGETTLLIEEPADTRVLSLDLQVVLLADFAPFRDLGVKPYALGGLGSLIVNPVGDGGRDLPTRSQSQISWGGGIQARLRSRWEARGEAIRARVRLADPVDPQNGDTTPIHTLRWEGRIQWLF